MNWSIPTYELFVSAEDEYAANNFFNVKAKRAGAIKDYENAVRYANTTYENTDDSFDTMQTNVAATGATNTNNTQRTTSANVTCTERNELAMDNNATTEINSRHSTVNAQNFLIGEMTRLSNLKLDYDRNTDVGVAYLISGAQIDQIAMTATNNMTASAIGAGVSIVGGIVSGGIAGSLPGAMIGGAAAGLNAANSCNLMNVSAAVAISTNQGVVDASVLGINEKTDNTIAINLDVRDATHDCNNNIRIIQNNATRDITDENTDAMDDNVHTMKTATDANAADTQTTNNANAVRTNTTETNNADYTRDATVAAEKANLVQKQLEAENMYKNARLQRPAEYSKYEGDFMPDVYQRRGVRFNIRTQTKAAIAQTGDAFLRFGYALHRVWDMSRGFHYCKNFTFWKAEDIWINDGSGVANVATSVIGNILLKGVTVWRDPNKIGTIGIYDNI